MLDLVLCASTNLFRTYLIYRFIQVFVGKRSGNKVKELFAYGMFFLATLSLYLTFRTAWINIASNFIGIALLVYTYTRSAKTILFVAAIIYLINAGCDAVCISLFVDYQDGEMFNQVYSVITVFSVFICELVTEKVISHKKRADAIQSFPLMLVPICSIFIIGFMVYSESISNREMIVISLGLLIINFVVFYLYNLLINMLLQKYENELLKQKNLHYSNQIQIILQSEEKVEMLRHDMKHHMNEIKLLAMRNDTAMIQCHASNYSSHLLQLYRRLNPASPSYRLSQRAVFYGTFLSALLTIPILSHIVFS